MIQRIQTIYLAIALLLQLVQFFMTWVSYQVDSEPTMLAPLEFDGGGFTVLPLTFVLSLSIGLLLGTITSFSNRTKQMRLGRMSMVAVLLGIVAFSLVHYMNISTWSEQSVEISYQFPVVLPFISALLIWMANKAIKKDEDLVKSVDRLR